MNIRKAISILGLLLAVAIILPTTARADEYDQASQLTFSQPVQIPGRVLPAGTYWFVLANTSIGNRNIIQIFNSDRSTLYATISTIAAERAQASDHSALTLAERDSTQPSAIVTWFYPGRKFGRPGRALIIKLFPQRLLPWHLTCAQSCARMCARNSGSVSKNRKNRYAQAKECVSIPNGIGIVSFQCF